MLGSEAWGQFIGPASEISIEVELLFEFESLVTGVRLPTPLALCEGIVIMGSCTKVLNMARGKTDQGAKYLNPNRTPYT